jgi:3-methylcrotonyl-CoA carboxylase beta subunit
VRNQGAIFLGGPPLVKAATGRSLPPKNSAAPISFAAIRRHRSLCQNDSHAIGVPSHRRDAETAAARGAEHPPSRESRFRQRNLRRSLGRRPEVVRVHDIIARLVDGSNSIIQAVRPDPDLRLHIWGYPVGIIANNGILLVKAR